MKDVEAFRTDYVWNANDILSWIIEDTEWKGLWFRRPVLTELVEKLLAGKTEFVLPAWKHMGVIDNLPKVEGTWFVDGDGNVWKPVKAVITVKGFKESKYGENTIVVPDWEIEVLDE